MAYVLVWGLEGQAPGRAEHLPLTPEGVAEGIRKFLAGGPMAQMSIRPAVTDEVPWLQIDKEEDGALRLWMYDKAKGLTASSVRVPYAPSPPREDYLPTPD